jgi:hypothetical protein
MKATLVSTSIYTPTFLIDYAKNAERYNHDLDIILVGDVKTPRDTREFCSKIKNCLYVDLDDQERYLQDFLALRKHIPKNSISRRNIANLIAYKNGVSSVIMIDDDNLSIPDQDCLGKHSIVGHKWNLPMYESDSKWFNICESLHEIHGTSFYPRGYPPAERWKPSRWKVVNNFPFHRVAVNAGLWTNDPDIDALTRLERRLLTSGMKNGWPSTFALSPGTWSPWNCQNTAISRAALPSYFLSPHAGRSMDIWASYVTTRIAEAQNEVVTFGVPLVDHQRSAHNLYEDLENELPWMKMTDEFCSILRSIQVPSTGYLDGLGSIIDGLDRFWITNHPVKEQYLEGLRIWYDIFKNLG